MKASIYVVVLTFLTACSSSDNASQSRATEAHAPVQVAKGPHNGRLLTDGSFAIELAIFETGVPPEFHAWPTVNAKPVPLDQVALAVDLTRLNKREQFAFQPESDYLRATTVVHEPHSFVVKVTATHAGRTHEWTYESFEGRTTIAADIAKTAEISTEQATGATLVQSLALFGRIVTDPARQREVSARYPGLIKSVGKNIGDRVTAGETLAQIEGNDSLTTYSLTAPIAGVITARAANPGEQSGARALFTIIDPSSVWAELSVFPRDRSKVRVGAIARVKASDADTTVDGKVERIDMLAGANQAVIARVSLRNRDNALVAGTFVSADVAVSERRVPLAVKTSGLQPFRDFMVVYEQVGQTYEVRMLELGEQQGEWVEVLGGLDPGATYVTDNSYVIKADIEKSGAAHEH